MLCKDAVSHRWVQHARHSWFFGIILWEAFVNIAEPCAVYNLNEELGVFLQRCLQHGVVFGLCVPHPVEP